MKKKFLDMIRKQVGLPEDVQNLIEYMEEVGQGQDCVIYQAGQFPVNFTGEGVPLGQPMTFRTHEERSAFMAGVDYAMKLHGGSIDYLNDQTNSEENRDQMDKISTHLLPHRKC